MQLWALWARSYLHPLLFFPHFTWEYSLRFLFFLLVYAGRYHIFQAYRSPETLATAFMICLSGQTAFYFILLRQPGEEWYLTGLFLIDYTVLAIFYGIILEFIIVIMGELWKKERPFGYDLSSPAQRFLAAEKGLTTNLRLTVYLVPVICLALYALNTRYIFDWTLYSRAAVIFLLLLFFLPLLRLQARLREAAASERLTLEERLVKLYACATYSSCPNHSATPSAAGCREEIVLLCTYHRFLLSSASLPWGWENLLPLLGGLLLLLSQPSLSHLLLAG